MTSTRQPAGPRRRARAAREHLATLHHADTARLLPGLHSAANPAAWPALAPLAGHLCVVLDPDPDAAGDVLVGVAGYALGLRVNPAYVSPIGAPQ